MFWESTVSLPQITENTTLEEFLDDDYALQHVASCSTDVLNFITNSENMTGLIDMVIDQSNITFDTARFKRPSVAAEILSYRIPSILDCIVPDTKELTSKDTFPENASDSLPLVDKLISFIDTQSPLNPLSSGFFVKIMINLFRNRANVLVPYFRTERKEFLPNVLRHIDLPAMAELLVEIPHQDNNQQHTIAEWFLDFDVFSKLLDMLSSPNESAEHQESAGKCLGELIGSYRNHVVFAASEESNDDDVGTNSTTQESQERPEAALLAKSVAVLDVLEGESFMTRLVDIIGDETTSPTARNSAIDILLSLVDKAKSPNGLPPSVGDECVTDVPLDSLPNTRMTFNNPLLTKNNCPLLKARIERAEATACSVLVPRLHKLYSLLQSSNVIFSSHLNYPQMPTTMGTLNPPLGKIRLAIINLISILPQLHSDRKNLKDLRQALCNEGFLLVFMDLFEKYPFNSLLHKAVVQLVKHLMFVVPGTESNGMKKSPSDDYKTDSKNSADAPSDKEKEESKEEVPELPPYLVEHVLQDCHIVEWILRLSCIPQNRLNNSDETEVCRLSKSKPKPGYSGHLWQIANIINNHFPTNECLEGISSETISKWRTFVEGDLKTLNEAQKITKADRNFAKPAPISLDSINIGGGGSQMAQLLRLLQGSSDFQILASRLGAISVGHTPERRTDPNEDAFDVETQESNDSSNSGNHEKEELETPNSDNDEDDGDSREKSSDSNSSDEEDLESPIVIRQQRTNQAQVILNSANGSQAPLVKLIGTAASPWPNEISEPSTDANSSTPEGDKTSDTSKEENWADFSSSSFSGTKNH